MKKFPLNLLNIKYFFDAVKMGSISSAAKMNFVTQSAVSQGITKLETIFGHELLDHHPNRFKTTQQGQKLFESVQGIFQAIERAEEAFSSESPKRVEFACNYSYAFATFPSCIKKAHQLYPQLQLIPRFELAESIKDQVKKGIVEFGILLDNVDLSQFEQVEIYHGKYQLYTSSKYETPLNPQFILDTEDRIETNVLKKAYKARFNKTLPIFMEMTSWEVVAGLVKEGLGVGLLPDYVAQSRKEGLKIYPQDYFSMSYKIYAIFSKDNQISPHVNDWLSILKSFHH